MLNTYFHAMQYPQLDALPDGPVQLAVTDVDGVLRGKVISKQKLLDVLKSGMGFCNVVFGWDSQDAPYDNTRISGWHTGYPDAKVQLDIDSLRRMSWLDDQPFLLGDFAGGALADVCPRTLLRRVLAKAEGEGYRINAALEYEWFNFRETPSSLAAKQGLAPTSATPGMHGYSLLRPGNFAEFNTELWQHLPAFGIALEGVHTETGPGVYEAAMHYTDALAAADNAVCFKFAVKQLALRHGLVASFMAKWRADLPGCGGHLHQSVTTLKGEDVFAASVQERSQQLDHYLAGQLYWLPKLMPLLAPTINSYKRLVEGSWAATAMSWGYDNRTVALRVLADRLETRLPGADANPYLVLAASVAAGMNGLTHKLAGTAAGKQALQQAATTGNAYSNDSLTPLPKTLHAAVALTRQHQEAVGELLGEEFIEHFLLTREWECRAYDAAVTDWERSRYLEII